MRVLAVCGMGLGSSLVLRMGVEAVLKELGVEATVSVSDLSSARTEVADLIVTSGALAEHLRTVSVPVVEIHNYMDREEIRAKLRAVLKQ